MFVYWPFFFSSRDLVFISTFMLLCLELENFSLFYITSRDGYSNAYRTGFHLAGSMPNSDDVRRREIPEKSCQKSKKTARSLRAAMQV